MRYKFIAKEIRGYEVVSLEVGDEVYAEGLKEPLKIVQVSPGKYNLLVKQGEKYGVYRYSFKLTEDASFSELLDILNENRFSPNKPNQY
jgi:hypothetical protein